MDAIAAPKYVEVSRYMGPDVKPYHFVVLSVQHYCRQAFPRLAFMNGCYMQAFAQHQQLAFEGYCHLPELQPKEWYWTEGSDQRGPYSVAELFDMAYGMCISPAREHNWQPFCQEWSAKYTLVIRLSHAILLVAHPHTLLEAKSTCRNVHSAVLSSDLSITHIHVVVWPVAFL